MRRPGGKGTGLGADPGPPGGRQHVSLLAHVRYARPTPWTGEGPTPSPGLCHLLMLHRTERVCCRLQALPSCVALGDTLRSPSEPHR